MGDLMHILETAVNAVVPVVLIVLLGYCLKERGFLSKEFVKVGSKVSFRVAMPIMLFVNVYNIESFDVIQWEVVIYSILAILVIFVLGMATVIFVTDDPKRKGAVLQATFRSNNAIVGLSLASVLGGPEAVAVASVVSAFTLPVMNIMAVIALTIYVNEDGKKKIDILGMLKKIAQNPLIIAISLGMLCLLIRGAQQRYFGRVVFALNDQCAFFYNALSNIKNMTSPYALLILGGQFDFSSSKGMLKEIVVGTAWRVIIAPLIVIGGAAVLSILGVMNCGVNEFPALIGVFGTPAAVSSAIMAGEMGNDEQLATQLVVWSSVASIFTMFLTVCILMAAGFLAV